MTLRFISFIVLFSLVGCHQDDEISSNNNNNHENDTIFSQLLDSDADHIPDIYDDFPFDSNEFIDANFNGIGDNQDGSDASRIGTIDDLHALSERLLSFQTGMGSLGIDASSTIASQALEIEQIINKKITTAKNNYNDKTTYNLSIDSQGNIINGKTLTISAFGNVVSDLYYLALASHREDENKAKQSAQDALNLIKWLRWNGVSHDDLSLVDSWYLSGFGQSILLLKDKLKDSGLDEYLLSIMWQGNIGKTGINELINFDYSSVDYRDQTYFSADLYRSEIFYHVAGIAVLPEDRPNQIRFKLAKWEQFNRYFTKVLQPSPGLHPFLKPDGSAYHHYTNYMSGYVPQAAYSLVRIAYMLHDSPWAMTQNQLNYLSKYITNYYFYSSLNSIPSGGRGRLTSLSMPSSVSNMLYLLAALRPTDTTLLQTAINYQQESNKLAYEPTYRLNQVGFPGELKALEQLMNTIDSGQRPQPLIGSYYYPYSSLYATRQDNWQATIKGLDRWTWNYEGGISATNPQNLYGMYESYGSLQLHYFDENKATNILVTNPVELDNGYQWSHIAGTTAPYRRLDEMLEDDIKSRYRLQQTSTGGTALTTQDGNSHGLYMLDLSGFLDEVRDTQFTAYKSYFQIGHKIIALGSSINNQATDILGKTKNYPIHTTLFHTESHTDAATSPIYIDNATITSTEYNHDFSDGDTLLLVDNESTGYFIPYNKGVTIQRGNLSSRKPAINNDEQTTLSHRNVAWIDHGTSTSNEKYEYVVLPKHDLAALDAFKTRYLAGQEYQIEAQNQNQHIVHDKAENVWAYALFSSANYTPKGPLISVELTESKPNEKGDILDSDDALVAMIELDANSMNIALAYPDLRLFDGAITGYAPDGHNTYSAPVVITVELEGNWKQAKNIEGIELSHADGNTHLSIELIDGLTRQVALIK